MYFLLGGVYLFFQKKKQMKSKLRYHDLVDRSSMNICCSSSVAEKSVQSWWQYFTSMFTWCREYRSELGEKNERAGNKTL